MQYEINFEEVVAGLRPSDFAGCTDDDFARWANSIVDNAIEEHLSILEKRKETMKFPILGHSTSQVFQDWESYYKFKSAEIREELELEREPLARFLMEWAAQGNKLWVVRSGRPAGEIHHREIKIVLASSSEEAETAIWRLVCELHDADKYDEWLWGPHAAGPYASLKEAEEAVKLF